MDCLFLPASTQASFAKRRLQLIVLIDLRRKRLRNSHSKPDNSENVRRLKKKTMTQFKVKFTLEQASKLGSLEIVQRLHQDAKLSNMNEKESRCRYSLLEFCYLKPNMTWREKTRIMTKHLVLWPFQQYVDNLEEIIDCAQAIFGFDQSIHLKLWPNTTHPAPLPPHEHHQLSEKRWATRHTLLQHLLLHSDHEIILGSGGSC